MDETANPYASPLSDEPPPQRQPRELSWLAFVRVAGGLQLIWLGIGFCLLAPVLILLIPLVGDALPLPFGIILGLGWILLFFAGALLNFTGSVACTAMPAETGARGLMFASLATMVGTVVLPFVVVALFANVGGLDFAMVGFAIWLLFQSASTTCFLLALRRLNRYKGRGDLVRWTDRILAVLIAATIVFGALMASTDFFTGRNAAIPPDAYIALMWLDGIIGWLAFLAEVILIRATRQAILHREPRGIGPQF